MNKHLLSLGTMCLMLFAATTADAQNVQEKELYGTDFSAADWGTFSRKNNNETPTVKAFKTKYSHENLTFTLCGVGAENVNNAKFSDVKRAIISAKYTNEVKTTEPYVVTSALADITKITFHQCATGGNRGWAVAVRTAGVEKWDTLRYESIGKAGGEDITINVNRQNAELKFFNFNISQNSYMSSLQIFGKVDMSKTPMLGTFTANGVTYTAADVFEENAKGDNVFTVEVSKKDKMISKDNAITAKADNGELGEITYESVESKLNGGKPEAKVTIPVVLTKADNTKDTALYIINFVWKPDYKVVYYAGDKKVAEQTVEKDAEIGTLNDGSEVTVAEGSKFRGWLFKSNGEEKANGKTPVSTPTLNLYALVTDIEGDEDNERHVYNLKDRFFYPEDHEALDLSGEPKYYFNGVQHGYGMNGAGKLSVKVNGNATIIYEGCQYDNAASVVVTDADGKTVATINKATKDGQKTTFKYTGDATTLTFTHDNTIYVHSLTVINTGKGEIAKNAEGYYVAEPGSATSVLNILDVIAANEDGTQRVKIFLPDGTYDFGQMVEKEFPCDNISFIGQSMDKTILVTTPDKGIEGLGSADMFFNKTQNLYFQDLTLKNALDYYGAGAAGRAAVMQDRGNRTIYKNVRMLSYQDTYYSQNSSMQSYFNGCDVHGTVDFICGGGDVRFDSTMISLEPRNAAGNGGRTVTAPTTTTQFGYVFDGCKVVDLANGNGDWNFGRTWQNTPVCVWLNTTLDENAEKTIISSRWTKKGMNNKDPKVFGEFGTKDMNGTDITPASNNIRFYKVNLETILTADQAAAYAYDKMYTDWDPKALSAQLSVAGLALKNGTLSWTATEGATAYAVFKDGKLQTITTSTTFAGADAKSEWSVRAANGMGGFGPSAFTKTATGISQITADDADVAKVEYFSLDGKQLPAVSEDQPVIVKKTMKDGSVVSTKIVR